MGGIGLPTGMSRDDAYVQGMADGEEALQKDLRSSYKMAMEAEGIDPETIERILNTVDDYYGNHYV